MGGFRAERIDHVELFVPDRREAAAWYAQALGLEVCKAYEDWCDDPRGPLMIATADGRSKLALFAGNATDAGVATQGFHRVAFFADAKAFVEFVRTWNDRDLRDAAGDALTDFKIVDHDASLSIYFRDPWGHALEVTTYECVASRMALGMDAP